MSRPRIDLDGVPLRDAAGSTMPLAVFRYRTTEGLVLLMPESADFTVPWEHVAEAGLDLASGEVRVVFAAEYARRANWLRGAQRLVGTWTDRVKLVSAPA